MVHRGREVSRLRVEEETKVGEEGWRPPEWRGIHCLRGRRYVVLGGRLNPDKDRRRKGDLGSFTESRVVHVGKRFVRPTGKRGDIGGERRSSSTKVVDLHEGTSGRTIWVGNWCPERWWRVKGSVPSVWRSF